MRTLTLILLLTSSPLACLATKCMEDCTQFKVDVPPKPESGYNTGKAVAAIFEGTLNAIRAKTFSAETNSFSYIAGGLYNMVTGLTEADEKPKMDEYNLAKGLQQTQDYLACVMEAQVSGAVYSINERMDNDRVNAFNEAVQGIVSYMTSNCKAHNCLNVSTVEPSVRNEAADVMCLMPYPLAKGYDCSDATWDPLDPWLCKGRDADGKTYDGLCGADNRCYHSGVGFRGTIASYQALKSEFMKNSAIEYFEAFNDVRNPTAVVAYAKGVMVYLSILQELHLLGAADSSDATARAFADRAAQWLQDRVDYHTNVNVTILTVQDANMANLYDQEPLAVRKSCKPGDVQRTEQWLGCSKAGSNFTTSTNFYLCTGKCDDQEQKTNAFYTDDPKFMTIRNIGQLHWIAAKEQAADSRQLFNNSGIYSIIESLKQMKLRSMPDNSHAFYQQSFTPKWTCQAPASAKPLLQAAPKASSVFSNVPSLLDSEAPDNLSKGSVVVHGVVIGGEKMKRVAEKATKARAAAPAKVPGAKMAPAPAKASGAKTAPAPAKAPGAKTTGRRLLAQ